MPARSNTEYVSMSAFALVMTLAAMFVIYELTNVSGKIDHVETTLSNDIRDTKRELSDFKNTAVPLLSKMEQHLREISQKGK